MDPLTGWLGQLGARRPTRGDMSREALGGTPSLQRSTATPAQNARFLDDSELAPCLLIGHSDHGSTMARTAKIKKGR
jgi:hypothetical protein